MERNEEWVLPASVIAAVAILTAAAVNLLTAFPGRPSGVATVVAALTIAIFTAFLRFLYYLLALWLSGEPHPIGRIREDFRPAAMSFVTILAGVGIVGAFLYSVSFLKSMIPAVAPFWADAALAASDRAMFVNPQAFALALQPALPTLGAFYALWQIVHVGGILWVLHWRRGNKARYIISFMLTWAIGMAFAYGFSSMGPIFTGQYDPSIAPVSVRKAADFLWANYQADGALLGGGISAFPSIHVAIAAWFWLVLRDRGVPIVGIAYLAGVFACSIILGWHYVLDGVAGIAIAIAADRLAGLWMLRATIQQGRATSAATGASIA